MSANIPLTIQCLNTGGNWSNRVVAGNNGDKFAVHIKQASELSNVYWYVIVDRISLEIKANFTATDNSKVPSELSPYLGNTQYIMIVSTQTLRTAYIPQGDLYKFFKDEGASTALEHIEQVYATLNCGNWSNMAYVFVAVLGDDGEAALEASTVIDSSILMTIGLMPTDVNGTTYYSPVSL